MKPPTHIFYSPHTDDETIGMAGAITRAVAAGGRVVLVLVTDNLPSERAKSYFADYAGDLAAARLEEWNRAAAALGVHDVFCLDMPEDGLNATDLVILMRRFDLNYCTDKHAIHHTVMGPEDTHAELGAGTRTHRVCADAAQRFKSLYPRAAVIQHGVYVYSHPVETRSAPRVVQLSDQEMRIKRAAIDAYKSGIGYGYASVPELLDAAANDAREFEKPLASLVAEAEGVRLYEGRADTWAGVEAIDLVFTNPYGPLPTSLRDTPMIIHQWCHRYEEAERWCGRPLELFATWNDGREAFWFANRPGIVLNLREFKPEPGGWYPPEMVRRILTAIDPGTRPFTIWDGFMGRGTIGKVARELGMSYVGVEELPKHIALARMYLGIDDTLVRPVIESDEVLWPTRRAAE